MQRCSTVWVPLFRLSVACRLCTACIHAPHRDGPPCQNTIVAKILSSDHPKPFPKSSITTQFIDLLLHFLQIFEFTIENLDRKWHFLTSKMEGGTREILDFPHFFSKSLLREIGPRHSYVVSYRHKMDASNPIFTSLGSIDLAALLQCSDADFCSKVKCAQQDFDSFQARWVNEAGLKWSGVNAIGDHNVTSCWSE